jgi:PBP1b-binding outer membrane lipoprotein LpoB
MKAMRLMTLVAVVVAHALLMQGCSTAPSVRADYDRGADFSKYHSFNFVSDLSTDKMGYSSLTTQQVKSAVTQQLQQRGYQLDAAKPDLLVNFSGRLQEKQSIESTPAPYYGYRTYGAWPAYTMSSDVYTVNYTEGTINVDLIDAQNMKMVWEGVTVGEVTKKHLKDREATINKAIGNIFAKYPFRAGTAQPIETAKK